MNLNYNLGKEYGEHCDSETPCNSNSNLVCNKICECKPNHIPIEVDGSYNHKCYPKGNSSKIITLLYFSVHLCFLFENNL
jgi:hypothetical protein